MKKNHPTVFILFLASLLISSRIFAEVRKDVMTEVLSNYLRIHKALSNDSHLGVVEAARTIAGLTESIDPKSFSGDHAVHLADIAKKLDSALKPLISSSEIKSARETFRELSKIMAMWASLVKPNGIIVAYCSMAKGSWVQEKGSLSNPYYGKSMLHCGEIVGGGK